MTTYRKKLTFAISSILLTHSAFAAKPVIEDRGLSNAKPLETQATKEWQMYQRIKAQNTELSNLRDQIERLEAKLTSLQKKTESRLTEVEQKTVAHEASLLGLTTEIDEKEGNSASQTDDTGTSSDAGENPLSNSDTSVDEDAAKKDYLAAYDAFKTAGAKAGISGMDAFIKKHAGSALVPSAHYWAGEFYLSEKAPDLDAAELRFATVVNRYPKDAKAPRALYRLANLADAEGKTTAAKSYMNKLVKNYPDAEQIKLAKDYLNKHK